MYREAAFLLVLILVCTGSQATRLDDKTASVATLHAAGESETARLNVALAVFDPGVPELETLPREKDVFPEVRKVEARYLPYVLRETLVHTNEWGAVRVVPEPDPTAEMLVSAKIVKSDGVTLELEVRALDSTGRKWLEKIYSVSADDVDNPSNSANRTDPFQSLYHRIADDLSAVRASLDEEETSKIVDVSLLRYATELAPEAFGDYLDRGPDGTLEIRRLPARDDPMLDRVKRIREFEYLFTDTMDEQYQALYKDIAPTYDLWRKYRRQLALHRKAEEERLRDNKPQAPRGSYTRMKQTYDNYRWAKIQEQILDQWATGFNNEVGPTVMELEGRLVELKGTLDTRYTEWRSILKSIFLLETGD